jgi:hypothetical protein
MAALTLVIGIRPSYALLVYVVDSYSCVKYRTLRLGCGFMSLHMNAIWCRTVAPSRCGT